MPDNGSAQSAATWPLVTFQFSVKFGDDEMIFQEVSGLSSETQVIEYRAGNNAAFSTIKMPETKVLSNIILKKGLCKDAGKMMAMHNYIKKNVFKPATVTISLLDEAHAPSITWKLSNAFPVKITMTDRISDVYEASIETMELAYEGLTITQ